MLDWIGDLLRWAARVIPRLIIVRRTHAGVKFVRGHKPVVMLPGIHLAWPLVTEWEIYPTARQSINLDTQTLITRDNQTVAVGAIVVYEVADVLKLIAESYDADDTIRDISLAAVKEYIVSAPLDDLRHRRMDRRLTSRLARALSPWGVNVIRANLSDLAPCRVVRVWNDAFTINSK